MEFTIKINMDNAAFSENPNDELLRVIAQATRKIDNNCIDDLLDDVYKLRDTNGNIVGEFELTK